MGRSVIMSLAHVGKLKKNTGIVAVNAEPKPCVWRLRWVIKHVRESRDVSPGVMTYRDRRVGAAQ
jgi:hypothetical protein